MKKQEFKYLTLYETLKREILSGGIPYGHKLPSKRVIASRYGLSILTVEHSIELLVYEGYVKPRERSGYFAVYKPGELFLSESGRGKDRTAKGAEEGEEARTPQRADRKIDPFPFNTLSKAMRKVLLDRSEAVLSKSPNAGLVEFRKAISEYLIRNRGITASPDQILIGSGAEYLYGLIVEAVGRGKIFGIEDPSYEKIRLVYERKGVTIEPMKLGEDGIVSEALNRSHADVLHISPFRSYPSGVTAGASKKQEYLSWAKRGKRIIVEDDFESEFSLLRKPEDTVYGLSGGKNVIYLNSFSRTVSPALRVGYMVIPKDLLEIFRQKVGFYSCTVPAFEQYLLTELLESGAFERHLNRIRRNLRRTGE